jgi:two-component system chemotaxis response regulator CheB
MMNIPGRKVRVLVIDDSALARKILVEGLSKDPQIEVVGAARDPFIAFDLLVKLQPDVITLDVEMPGMDGVTLLRKIMQERPTPAVMVSSLTEQGKQITLDALEAGAVDFVAKPRVGVVDGLPALMGDICARVKAASRARLRHTPAATPPALVSMTAAASPAGARLPQTPMSEALNETTDRIIALGTSAGGVAALARILPAFPAASPGMVIVQHMPAGFTAGFAQRLDSLSAMEVREAKDGDRIRPGLALLAPGGDRHLEVHRSGGEYRAALVVGPKVSGHQPSVDALFRSIARQAGSNTAAALLTGMGEDGAAGLLAIRTAGGRTLCQDEATSVVWGMPGAAWKLAAAEAMLPLDEIPGRLLAMIGGSRPKGS